MSIMVAMGRGASVGVLFKNAEAIERLCRVDTLVIDKTRTLTEGKPQLTHAVAVDGVSESDLLRWVASVERHSEHPLGAALLAAASARELELAPVQGFESSAGKGVSARVEGRQLLPDQKSDVIERLQREGRIVAMAGDGINDAGARRAKFCNDPRNANSLLTSTSSDFF